MALKITYPGSDYQLIGRLTAGGLPVDLTTCTGILAFIKEEKTGRVISKYSRDAFLDYHTTLTVTNAVLGEIQILWQAPHNKDAKTFGKLLIEIKIKFPDAGWIDADKEHVGMTTQGTNPPVPTPFTDFRDDATKGLQGY